VTSFVYLSLILLLHYLVNAEVAVWLFTSLSLTIYWKRIHTA